MDNAHLLNDAFSLILRAEKGLWILNILPPRLALLLGKLTTFKWVLRREEK